MPDRAELVSVAEALAKLRGSGVFATRIALAAEPLQIAVKGVGPIRLPVSAATAQSLIAVAKPAKYGQGTQTLRDRRVRDTWVVAKSRIAIDATAWRDTQSALLERIRRDLGLADTTVLRADLHDLLVYERGQFFAAHQDSEKHDDMIGTLVVMLPSASSGGAMDIVHHDARLTVRGSAKQLICAAFYADCRHEVSRVTAGHRVVLTFTLRAVAKPGRATAVTSTPVMQGPPDPVIEDLAQRVQAHFDRPITRRYAPAKAPELRPDRLVFLLDHEYTERGLDWDRLKNGDGVRAIALRDAANRIGCDVRLAQADVCEAWMCEGEDEYDRYRGSRRRRWRSREDDDVAPSGKPVDHPDLVELFETTLELRDPATGRRGARAKLEAVDFEAEVCWTRPSVELTPFNWSHEGYTGNAGDTVDRWYHRAAVVLTPRARAFTVLAKRSPADALARVGRLANSGAVGEARALMREIAPVWEDAVRDATAPALLRSALRVACDLDDAELAAALLRPLELPPLTAALGEQCGELAARYGAKLCVAALEAWVDDHAFGDARGPWLVGAAGFCRALVATARGATVAHGWVEAQWVWCSSTRGEEHPDRAADREEARHKRTADTLVALLRASVLAKHAKTQREILQWLVRDQSPAPRELVAVLRVAHGSSAAGELPSLASLGLGPALNHCIAGLAQGLAAPLRARDDWSIGWEGGCGCTLCGALADFLDDETLQTLEMPLGNKRRRHVHGKLNFSGLPVTHETRRTGSPQVLVLRKTAALFKREAAERRWCTEGLAWATEVRGAFGGRGPGRRRR